MRCYRLPTSSCTCHMLSWCPVYYIDISLHFKEIHLSGSMAEVSAECRVGYTGQGLAGLRSKGCTSSRARNILGQLSLQPSNMGKLKYNQLPTRSHLFQNELTTARNCPKTNCISNLLNIGMLEYMWVHTLLWFLVLCLQTQYGFLETIWI